MNGTIFVLLQQYTKKKGLSDLWIDVLKKEGFPESKLFFSHEQYPDNILFHVIFQAAQELRQTPDQFLEEFGRSLGSYFFLTYKSVIDPCWKTLDLLEKLEEFNKNILQKGIPLTLTGTFSSKRVNPNNIIVVYSSPRQLCCLCMGLFKAFAIHYNEQILIHQPKCMLKNDPCCEFNITCTEMAEASNPL